MIPGSACGSTTRRIVCQRVPPRLVLTSRNDWGTARRASSAVLMITGSVIVPSVSDPATIDVPKLRKMTNRPKPKRP